MESNSTPHECDAHADPECPICPDSELSRLRAEVEEDAGVRRLLHRKLDDADHVRLQLHEQVVRLTHECDTARADLARLERQQEEARGSFETALIQDEQQGRRDADAAIVAAATELHDAGLPVSCTTDEDTALADALWRAVDAKRNRLMPCPCGDPASGPCDVCEGYRTPESNGEGVDHE